MMFRQLIKPSLDWTAIFKVEIKVNGFRLFQRKKNLSVLILPQYSMRN